VRQWTSMTFMALEPKPVDHRVAGIFPVDRNQQKAKPT
jgi:hypothetical protein